MNKGNTSRNSKKESDSSAMSVRQECFWWFDLGLKPVKVASLLGVSINTVHRYYAQWKKMVPWFQLKYQAARNCAHKLTNRDRRAIAETLANELGTSCDAVTEYMSQPWALKQLVNNEWRQWLMPQVDKTSTGKMTELKNRLFSGQISEEAEIIIEIALNPDWSPVDDLGFH